MRVDPPTCRANGAGARRRSPSIAEVRRNDTGHAAATFKTSQLGDDLLDGFVAQRRGGDVRGHSNFFVFPDRVSGGNGFLIEDVESRAGKLPALQRRQQRVDVEMPAASDVDQVAARS